MRAETFRIPFTKITQESMKQAAEKARSAKDAYEIYEGPSELGDTYYWDNDNSLEHAYYLNRTIGARMHQEDVGFGITIEEEWVSNEVAGQALFNAGIEFGVSCLADKKNVKVGSTATACYVNKHSILTLQEGDSAAFLISIKNGRINAQRLTEIHSPNEEKNRIMAAGGKVIRGKLGHLAISRSFGDAFMYEKGPDDTVKSGGFTFEPSISLCEFDKEAENYLFLCTDGICAAMGMNIDKVMEILIQYRGDKDFFEKCSDAIHEKASKGGDDNRASLLVKLNPGAKKGALFGVADGHGGVEIADNFRDSFHEFFSHNLRKKPEHFPGLSLTVQPNDFKLIVQYENNYQPYEPEASSFVSLHADSQEDSDNWASYVESSEEDSAGPSMGKSF